MSKCPKCGSTEIRREEGDLKEHLARRDYSSTCTSVAIADTANYTLLREPTCTWDINVVTVHLALEQV